MLELIQNADDNSYPAASDQDGESVTPALKFVLNNEGVIVLNNECGFEEKNIRALCDVGKSTKGKHKIGYIGQLSSYSSSEVIITSQFEPSSELYQSHFIYCCFCSTFN